MTRMWCVDTAVLCDQHLLGEHKELHQLVGHIRADNLNAVRGHADRQQINTSRITERHDRIRDEMLQRGMNHNSPLEYDDSLDLGEIDEGANLRDLTERCDDCARRVDERHGRVSV